MTLYGRIKKFFLDDLWRIDLAGKPTLKGRALGFLRMLYLMTYKLDEDNCLQRAASLTFTTAFALVPLVAVVFAVFQGFGGLNAYGPQMEDFIKSFFAPEYANDIVGTLSGQAKSASMASLGIIGVSFLLISAVFLLNTVESAFNSIWRVQKRRPFLVKFVSFWAILSLGPLLIGVSIFITTKIAVSKWHILFLGQVLGFLLAKSLPFLVSWTLFFLAYKFFPHTRVSKRAALAGALISGTLWEVSKLMFGYYSVHMTSMTKIYGALSIFPILLLWLYFSWIIVMFGAEISYAVQTYRVQAWQRRERLEGHTMREVVGLRVMMLLAENFTRGEEPLSEAVLAERLGMPRYRLEQYMDNFKSAGLVHVIDGLEKTYVPARPLNRITVFNVINASVELGWLEPRMETATAAGFYARISEKINQAVNEAFGKRTLEEALVEMEDVRNHGGNHESKRPEKKDS